MSGQSIQLTPSWLQVLQPEFDQPYIQSLRQFLAAEKQQGKVIFPPGAQMFNALNSTPFDQVKVVILGQDPYHGPGQAHGLSFSVPPGIAIPPSLRNIYKEIERDLGIPAPQHGCLQHWAEQGVLLLNATLSVEQGNAGSHQGQGWEPFTDAIVDHLNREREGLVFMLWGSYAQKKGRIIDRARHCVLQSPHPSPLSAHRGFLGNGHFSKANAWLQQRGEMPIDWAVPPL
ncbi:uracil-DNA glycosylase [Pseudomaricurvus sp. HS19]|uniref:uracil-DNA glycosylase n=1 Tax=Pseudomaricurvus sp. HS19 TaxID=2692626 RepID=UPI001371D89A|nr:uracil-DNA glycosylase [Pseudomaricurvus sp. HS19]MYM62599.1 uracil-DNA glycosylase [Pseudomaricurvus sp. HS19]